ncbi:hypothetical protein [Streptomyces sp. NPDC047046]|uniref:MutS-related protein n=1 Tax=Streptomyces sp. NPDC047046 TaxID=3155378 RepID=UPI0033F2CD80
MPHPSVLSPDPQDAAVAVDPGKAPSFVDLHLDQLVDAVTIGRSGYDLAPFFRTRADDAAVVYHRQDVFRDLERDEVAACVEEFSDAMRVMRDCLTMVGRLRHHIQRASWFLDAAAAYIRAVTDLRQGLREANPSSDGLGLFGDWLDGYARSRGFGVLAADVERVRGQLRSVEYNLTVTGGRVKVSQYEGEADYGAAVLAAFDRFRQDTSGGKRSKTPRGSAQMNSVEEAVIDRVAALYPDAFSSLSAFATEHEAYLDDVVAGFDREIQFFLTWRAFCAPLKRAGLPFCYPELSGSAEEYGVDVYDVVLADKLVEEHQQVVLNDFRLEGPERILVVSGPNQGGKTTFARCVGQLHHLAALGCPVPGRHVRVRLADQILTHFERGENLADLSGKLRDDLIRMREILEQATPTSIVIMNEVFTSTTLHDATVLGTRILQEISDRGLVCVCVTFVDELSRLNESTVSMVSTVDPKDPAKRTYRVVRKPADGRSYALSVAEKYALTRERLRKRISGRDGRGTGES